MSEPPPKKKRKPGGSFCAMGGMLEQEQQGYGKFAFTGFSIKREAVCCHDRPEVLDLMVSASGCITAQNFFQVQLLSDEGLQYNRLIFASLIKDTASREKFLGREFDNGLKRHLCYRNF